MKYLVAALLLVLSACRPAVAPPAMDLRTAAERAEDRSVALLSQDSDGDWHPSCSAVWISSDRILTAYHCIRNAGKPKDLDSLWGLPFGALWDPTGHEVGYTDRQGSTFTPIGRYVAKVLATDEHDDLAVLSAELLRPMHHDFAP